MHTHRNPMIVWTVVLVLILSACGGGGSSLRVISPTDRQEETVDRAIQDARRAVRALGGSDGSTYTETDFENARTDIAAARNALKGADAVSASTRAERSAEIDDLDDDYEAAKTRAGAEAGKLAAAFSGARITGIGAALAHGEAPRMSGTVPGSPATAVSGLETAAAGGASTAGGWQWGRYTATGEGTADMVALYTNLASPGSRPFSGENGKYSADNGLDYDGNLPIAAGTDTTRIVSAGFPAGPGLRTHEPGASGTVLVSGSFDGAPGTFVCTPAAGSACMSSIKDGGGYTLTGGDGWKFVPAEGARVPEPDGEYQYFGWWLREADGVYAIGVFHGGEGGAMDEFADLAALQGRAVYRGPAAGKFTFRRPLGVAEAGGFTATAELEVDFGDATAPGAVEGAIKEFMVEGQAKDWSIALESAAIDIRGTIFSGGVDTALTRWTIGGVEAETTATWSGQFHEADLDRTPTVATGSFDAVHGDIGRMTGAFGTARIPTQLTAD